MTPDGELQRRLAAVRRPRPRLSRRQELALTRRQREVLDALDPVLDGGFADLTMAELARRVSCSLRTLYSLAPSRDELVLVVVDRRLWRVGRAARTAVEPGQTPLQAVRAYLRATTEAVSRTTPAFGRDLAAVPDARELADAHHRYLYEVVHALLALAVERGEVRGVDTTAVAIALAGLGRAFAGPDLVADLASSPKQAADEVVDLVLAGLAATRERTAGDLGRRPATPPARRRRHRLAAPVTRSV